jgi:hypothetical protein
MQRRRRIKVASSLNNMSTEKPLSLSAEQVSGHIFKDDVNGFSSMHLG